MRISLVFDDDPGATTQHRRRMDALADALIRHGFDPHLVPAGEPVHGGTIVCDSYQTRADDRWLYRGERIIAVDMARRDLDVDLVIDPRVDGRAELHRRARCLAVSARYTLVDPSICDLLVCPPRPVVALVAVQGDIGLARQLRRRLARVDVVPLTRPSMVAPEDDPGHRHDLRTLASADVAVVVDDVGLAEAMALGRPTVAVASSSLATAAIDAGAVLVTRGEVLAAVSMLIDDRGSRDRLFRESRRVIDGLGAARVADEVARQVLGVAV